MKRTLFLPSPRQLAVLAAVAAAALGYALYLRYVVIQDPAIGIACGTARSWLCTSRQVALMLHMQGIFGWAALLVALLHLWRPSVLLLAVGLAAAAFGLVLYNVQLAALAAAILLLSLARRAPEPE